MVEMKWSLTAVVVNDEKEEGGEEQKKRRRYTEIALFSVLWQIATMLASPNSQQLLLQRKMSP